MSNGRVGAPLSGQDLLAQLGYAVRVVPSPNLAQSDVMAAHFEGLRALAPIIVEWQRRLPTSRQWLFGGSSSARRPASLINAYYYPTATTTSNSGRTIRPMIPTTSLIPAKA